MMFRFAVLMQCVVGFGCTQPPAAPTELGDLTAFLYQEFDAEGEDAEGLLADGAKNLYCFLAELDWSDVDLGGDREGREWMLPVLGEEVTAALPRTPAGVDPADQVAVGVAAPSDYPPPDHGVLVGMADQTPIEASSTVAYEREFLSEIECFGGLDCERVETFNTVHRVTLIIDLVYEAYKDYRWIELPGDHGTALLARSYMPAVFHEEDGSDSFRQSYNLDVWLPHDEGALRYMAYWVDVEMPLVEGDHTDLIVDLTGDGMDEIYLATDEYLDAHQPVF